jgi:RNA-directed DNA polymerase
MEGKRVERAVKNLRPRSFRASRAGGLQHVKALQRLRLRSRANIVASVRRVTPMHQGQETPGVDHLLVTTPAERAALCRTLRQRARHQGHPGRRGSLPKRKGRRPRGLPPSVERGVRALGKNALEPLWAARLAGMSDGCRPGRGGHEAIQQLFSGGRPQTARPWGLDAELEGAFDHSGPAALVQASGNFPARG